MNISARIQLAKNLRAIGAYHWRPLITSLIGFVSGLTVFATLTPDMLPDFMLLYHPYLVGIGRTAVVIGVVAGAVLAQTSQKVLPKLPEEEPQ